MNDKELKELQTIKKLLVVQLLVNGIAAADLAELIGMDPADFSRVFPARKLLKNVKRSD